MKLYSRTVNDMADGGASSDGGVSSQSAQYQTRTAVQKRPLRRRSSISRAAATRCLAEDEGKRSQAVWAACVRRDTPVTAMTNKARGSTKRTSARISGTRDCERRRSPGD